MRLRNFFQRFRKPKFSSIRILQPYQNRYRFPLVLKKRSVHIHNIHQTSQNHHHHIQNNLYRLHVTMQTLDQFPVSMKRITKVKPVHQAFMRTTILPIQQLQNMSDDLIHSSIQKQQDYYKYHPTAARETALSILQQSPAFQIWSSTSYHRLPSNITQMLPSTMHLYMREIPKPIATPVPPEQTKKILKTTLEITEYRKLIEDVIQNVEQRLELKQRRRGRG